MHDQYSAISGNRQIGFLVLIQSGQRHFSVQLFIVMISVDFSPARNHREFNLQFQRLFWAFTPAIYHLSPCRRASTTYLPG